MHRVVIAEDQAIAREALRLVLEREGYDVVGEAADGLEATRLLRAQRPDLLVLGLRLRRLNGIEVMRRARRALPSMKMLVLSEIDNALTISQCEEAGASGFVSKTDDFAEVFLALRAIEHGSSWFPAQDRRGGANDAATQDASLLDTLSQREQSVLGYLAQGVRIRDIAADMALDERTISTYKARLLRKLNAHSVVELVDIARRLRLAPQVEPPTEAGSEDAVAAGPYPDFHALIDTFPFSVSVRALDGRTVFANRYLRTRLGPERFEAFRSVGLREQVQLFGADDATAQRIESAFADAVARGADYRLDAVADSGGEPSIGVHWGAPLTDAHGAISLMICGSFNVNGAERIMVGLHEAMATALASSEARAALLDTLGDDVSLPLAEAIALLESVTQRRDATTAARLAEARSRLQLAEMRFDHLRLLGATSKTLSGSSATRCDLREATRRVVQTVEDDMAALDARFSTRFSGRGSASVWLDETRYARLLGALLHLAARADSTGEIPVEVHALLRGGGIVEVELRIGAHGAAAKARKHRTATADTQAAQLELTLCRQMAQALRAELSGDSTSGLVLKLELPRGSETA